MRRVRFLATAALAIVAVAVFVLYRGGEAVATAQGPSAPPSAAPDLAGAEVAALTGKPTRTSVAAVEPTPVPAAPNGDEPLAEIARGDVFGYVFGYSGEPLARHGLGLEDEDSGSWARRTQTDADGFYSLEGIPAGDWEVVYTGHVAFVREASSVPDVAPSLLEENDLVTGNENARVRVGTVRIEGGRQTRFDVRLSGTRVLAGTFRYVQREGETGGNCLIVELRPERAPETVAASAGAAYHADDPRSAYVRFTGLIPDVYLLRVLLDTVDPNHRPYVEWPVDLLEGDVDAGVHEFVVSRGPEGFYFHELTDEDE